jgi:hypothetical protein
MSQTKNICKTCGQPCMEKEDNYRFYIAMGFLMIIGGFFAIIEGESLGWLLAFSGVATWIIGAMF